jgi:hypothetical protein
MLAIIYLAAATTIGDMLCRRFFRFVSVQHRIATAFLVGLLFSTWVTFLAAVLFHSVSRPLLAANVVFILVFGAVVLLSRRWPSASVDDYSARPLGKQRWDFIWLGVCLVFACWLMFRDARFQRRAVSNRIQSVDGFWGQRFTDAELCSGQKLSSATSVLSRRIHSLPLFVLVSDGKSGVSRIESGLERKPARACCRLMALMILIATLGEILFKSRIVGRIGAALFFFSSSLSYLPFLRAQPSIRAALSAITGATDFLPSGYPFRGETWGVLSANVFAYQRHLISGIGLFFVALTFAVDEYQRRAAIRKEKQIESILPLADEPAGQAISPEPPSEVVESPEVTTFAGFPSWIFAGNAHRVVALLEQSDVYRRPRGVWVSAGAGAFAKQDSSFAGCRNRCWFAAGSAAPFR